MSETHNPLIEPDLPKWQFGLRHALIVLAVAAVILAATAPWLRGLPKSHWEQMGVAAGINLVAFATAVLLMTWLQRQFVPAADSCRYWCRIAQYGGAKQTWFSVYCSYMVIGLCLVSIAYPTIVRPGSSLFWNATVFSFLCGQQVVLASHYRRNGSRVILTEEGVWALHSGRVPWEQVDVIETPTPSHLRLTLGRRQPSIEIEVSVEAREFLLGRYASPATDRASAKK